MATELSVDHGRRPARLCGSGQKVRVSGEGKEGTIMSAYGSGTGPEYLDDPWPRDPAPRPRLLTGPERFRAPAPIARSLLAPFDLLDAAREDSLRRGAHPIGPRGRSNPECCEDCADLVRRDARLDAQERRDDPRDNDDDRRPGAWMGEPR